MAFVELLSVVPNNEMHTQNTLANNIIRAYSVTFKVFVLWSDAQRKS